MVFTVSVRDAGILEEMLRSGGALKIPAECESNAKVLYTLLKEAPRVLPTFTSLTEEEVMLLAKSVAYLMRPEIIISGKFAFGAMPLDTRVLQTKRSDDPVHFRNNPDILTPDFELPQEGYTSIGAEFFRCYNTCIQWCPRIKAKIAPENCVAAFRLADMTAFLVEPQDLVDYKYTISEVADFRTTLERELEDV